MRQLLAFLWPIRYYALLLLPVLGWFAWGTATGTRLLGDDSERTETPAAPGTGGRVGHSSYYHK